MPCQRCDAAGDLPLLFNKRAPLNGSIPRPIRPEEPDPGSMKAAQDIWLRL